MVSAAMSWHIGLVGFSYPEWVGTFYRGVPRGPVRHTLRAYAMHFNAVEVNTSFYGVPSTGSVIAWRDSTPPSFRFCIKMIREVTHGPTPPGSLAAWDGPPPGHLLRRDTLAKARELLEAVEPLQGKLGAILLQFPPRFAADRIDELGTFLDRLSPAPPLAVEFRHGSWDSAATEHILRSRAACWVISDEAPRHVAAAGAAAPSARLARALPVTSDFLYIRWLGKHGQFPHRRREHFDPSSRLRWWAARLKELADVRPEIKNIYGFFDNDFAGHAPATAKRFMEAIGVTPPTPETPSADEPTLFG